jgi:hypothetical protein
MEKARRRPENQSRRSDVTAQTARTMTVIRAFVEESVGAYDDFQFEFEEVHDLGNGVAFAVAVQSARLAGSTGLVRDRYAVVSVWADGLVKQITNYPYSDRNEARADAERLAEARG